MIAARIFLMAAFSVQVIFSAYTLPSQSNCPLKLEFHYLIVTLLTAISAGLHFSNTNKTNPPFPTIISGRTFSSATTITGTIPLHVTGFDPHTLNHTISPVNSNGSDNSCWFIVQDTVNIRYWAGMITFSIHVLSPIELKIILRPIF